LTDLVHACPPETVEFELDVGWHIERRRATSAAAISNAVNDAVQGWLLWQRSSLGRDINPSELIRRMMDAGAKRVSVNSPEFAALEFNQIGMASDVAVAYGGVEDG
jgi:phage-related baseplate assembly protein